MDDTGQPLEGTTVRLGMVNDERSLPGQKPRTWTCNLHEPADRTNAFPGFAALGDLPEPFRVTTTDAEGRYELRGLPPSVRAAISADYKPDDSMFSGKVISRDGESRRTGFRRQSHGDSVSFR